MKMNKADTEPRSAKAEEVKICDICGEMIIGEYDYVRTRRFQSTPHTQAVTIQTVLLSKTPQFQSTPHTQAVTTIVAERASMSFISIHTAYASGDSKNKQV